MSIHLDVVFFPDPEEAALSGYNYNEWEIVPKSTRVVKAVIVRGGTESGKPTVDFISEDAEGNKQVFMITSTLLAQIVAIAHAGQS